MKRLITIIALATIVPLFAQNQGEKKIVVNETDLTADQLAKIKTREQIQAVKDKAAQVGAYANAVNEVGTAIAESSHELTTATINFSNTKLGKTTMALVLVHLLGNDAMGYIMGIPLVIFIIHVFVLTWHRNCCLVTFVKQVHDEADVTQEQKNGGIRHFWPRFGRHHSVKTYETAESMAQEWHWGTLGFMGAAMLISMIIILS